MENTINYTPNNNIKAKSVPMFPKGINRMGDFGTIEGQGVVDTPAPNELTEEQKLQAQKDAEAEAQRLENEKNNPPSNNDNPPTPIDFDNGNFEYDEEKGLVDDKGEVIKSKEDLTKEGYFNEEGKLINPTTKEVINFENNQEEIPLIQEIQTVLGYEIQDETGKPKIYEDTTQGIAELIKDIAEVQHKQSQQEFLESNPELVAYYNHLKAGGNRESFFNYRAKDYTTINFAELDADQRANIIYEDYIKKGFSETRAKGLVELHKTNNEVDAVADESLKSLIEIQKNKEQADALAAKERDAKNAKDIADYWANVTNTVKAGKIGNILISEADKQSFLEYISTPIDKNGTTKHNQDAAKEDVNFQLQLAYWRFKGYDFNKMVANMVKSEKVNTLRQKIKNSKKASNQQDIRDDGNNNLPPNSVNLPTIS